MVWKIALISLVLASATARAIEPSDLDHYAGALAALADAAQDQPSGFRTIAYKAPIPELLILLPQTSPGELKIRPLLEKIIGGYIEGMYYGIFSPQITRLIVEIQRIDPDRDFSQREAVLVFERAQDESFDNLKCKSIDALGALGTAPREARDHLLGIRKSSNKNEKLLASTVIALERLHWMPQKRTPYEILKDASAVVLGTSPGKSKPELVRLALHDLAQVQATRVVAGYHELLQTEFRYSVNAVSELEGYLSEIIPGFPRSSSRCESNLR